MRPRSQARHRLLLAAAFVVVVAASMAPRGMRADQIPPGWAADHMKAIGYSDLDGRGGAFKEYHLPDVEKQGDLIYATYFNAGLRIFDIRDPRAPTEVGWFIPPTPTRRRGPIPAGTLVTQTEDVLVDRRGNIYLTDKQWGLFVVRYTGAVSRTTTQADEASAPAGAGGQR